MTEKYNESFIRSHFGKPVFGAKTVSILASCFAMCMGGISEGSVIFPKDSETSSSETQPESFESYQIRILRNQNLLQAEKIKVLREELLEVNQKLHELKPHLFKKSDPADQERIAELTQLLSEKESHLTKLNENKRSVETELAYAKKKLSELETVKDALTDMVEKHRSNNEQNTAEFRKNIEELREIASNEKNQLLKKIQQHEVQKEQLSQTLEDRNKTVARLDAVASSLDSRLTKKNLQLENLKKKIVSLYDDILATTEAYTLHHHNQEMAIQGLSANLESEKIKNRQLAEFKEQLHWLSDVFEGSKSLLHNEIENLKEDLKKEIALNKELSEAKSQLDLKRNELSVILATHVEYKNDMEQYVKDLVASIEKEQIRSKALESQYNEIQIQQEAGKQYAASLEGILAETEEILSTKHAELEAANANHMLLTGSLLLQLENADTALDHHHSYQETFEKYLALLDLQTNIVEQARSEHHEQILQGHKETYQNWQDKLAKLTEEHQIKERELTQKLKEALAKHESGQASIQDLTVVLEDAKRQSEFLASELASHQQILSEKEEQLRNLQESQQYAYNQLETRFNSLAQDLEQELHHSYNLEAVLQSAADHLVNLEGNVAEQTDWNRQLKTELENALGSYQEEQKSNRDLQEKSERLSEELEEKLHLLSLAQNKASTIDYDNQDLARQNDELYSKLKELEDQLAKEMEKGQLQANLIENLHTDLEKSPSTRSDTYNHDALADLQVALAIKNEELLLQKVQNEEILNALSIQLEANKLDFKDYAAKAEADINNLQNALNEEQNWSTFLEDDGRFARQNYLEERSNLRNLQDIYQDVHQRNGNLEELLEIAQLAMESKNAEIAMLASEQEHLNKTNEDLRRQLSEELEAERKAHQDARETLASLRDAHDDLSQKTRQHLEAHHDLESQYIQIAEELERERNAHRNVQDQLDKALTLYQLALEKVGQDTFNQETADESGSSRMERIHSLKSGW